MKKRMIKNRKSYSGLLRLGVLSTSFLLMLGNLSCSKDEADAEVQINETATTNAKVSSSTANKAKLQIGKGGSMKEVATPGNHFKKGVHHNSANFFKKDGKLVFKANGKLNRSELRYKNGFTQNAKKTFKASVNVTSKGMGRVSVMQLHNDSNQGPILKLQYRSDGKGSGTFGVLYRKKAGNKDVYKHLKTGTSGTFKISFNKRGVVVSGDNNNKISFTINNNGWKGKYYWKTGAYNQTGGQSRVLVNNISW